MHVFGQNSKFDDFSWNLILYLDYLAHVLSKNVYFNAYTFIGEKIKQLEVFPPYGVNTNLKNYT